MSGRISSILEDPALRLALPFLLSVPGHGSGQIRYFSSSRTPPPPPPTSDLFQRTCPLVSILIFLKTFDGVRTYQWRTYVGNTDTKRDLQIEIDFCNFFVSDEVAGSRQDETPQLAKRQSQDKFTPPTLILQSGSPSESLMNFLREPDYS